MLTRLAAVAQHLLPQHGLSRLVHALARRERPPGQLAFMRWFVRHYGVDLTEAAEPDLAAYPNFNAFFTRALRPGARTFPGDEHRVASPVDGRLSQWGAARGNHLLQAKGREFSLTELLAGDAALARTFRDGPFVTIYLSPGDYHRVHMPVSGRLREMIHVPGRLFSVSPGSVATIGRIYARNERVIARFDTALGPMAVILVGALNVGSIETVWAGEVTPPRGRRLHRWTYPDQGPGAVELTQGAEMGRFNLGSTVIVLFRAGAVEWHRSLEPDQVVRLGQVLGEARTGSRGPDD